MNKKTFSFQEYTIEYLVKNTHIAPFQRLKDTEHVDIIYKGILDYYILYGEIFLPNLISLAKKKDEPKMIVLDGQHRLSSLSKLFKEHPEISDFKIRADVYEVQTYEEALDIYNIINSSKKVELYTGNIAPIVIPRIQTYFKERFKSYCKTSDRPNGLNINLDHMGKRIQAYDLINKMGITLEDNTKNTDYVISKIQELNQFYSRQTVETLVSYGHKESIINDIRESKEDCFYLGLYKKYEWIERVIDSIHTPYENQDHSITEKIVKVERKKIPASLRVNVWNKRFDRTVGKCYCCEKEMSVHDFECGHIMSVRNGGKNTIDNLEVVCRTCNLNMGTIDMNLYKELFKV